MVGDVHQSPYSLKYSSWNTARKLLELGLCNVAKKWTMPKTLPFQGALAQGSFANSR